MTPRAGGRRRQAVVRRRTAGFVAFIAAVAAVAAVALVLILVGAALAASPSPTTAAGGDPRSAGQGPGLVGDPVTAIAVVALVALASLAATLLYVRLTGGQGNARAGGRRPER